MAEEGLPNVVATLDAIKEGKGAKADLSADQALFDKITADTPLRDQEPKEEKPKPRRRQSQQKPKEAPTEPTEAAEEPVEDEEVEDAPEVKEPDPRVVEAREKLKGRFPATAVDAATDSEALSWWNTHNEADYDRSSAKEQTLALRREMAELRQSQAPPAPEPVKVVTEDEIASQLKDEFGEDGAKLMAGLLAPMQRENAELKTELTSIKDGQDSDRRQSAERVKTENHGRLKGIIPQLKNPAALTALDATAESLLEKGGSFTTAEELYDQAAQAIYGEEILTPPEDDPKPEKRKRIRSNQMSEDSRRAAAKPKTASERDQKVFAGILEKTKQGGYPGA